MSLRSLTLSLAALAFAAPLAAVAQTTTSTVSPAGATVTHSSMSQTTTKHSETVQPVARPVHRTHRVRGHRHPTAHHSAAVEKTTTVTPGAVSTTVKSTETVKK